MSVARGSRDKSGQATCSLGDRARPYEVKFQSPADQALDNLSLHIAVEPFLSAVEARYAGKADRVEVMDYFGRDEIRGPFARRALNFWRRVCRANHPASRRSLSSSQRTWWKKYTRLAGETAYRGGLPIHLLREVENYVSEHLAEEMSIERLVELAELSASHFAQVFRRVVGVTPTEFRSSL